MTDRPGAIRSPLNPALVGCRNCKDDPVIRITERPSDHADAARRLGDVSYLVYCLTQACKLFLKLVGKRWPEAA